MKCAVGFEMDGCLGGVGGPPCKRLVGCRRICRRLVAINWGGFCKSFFTSGFGGVWGGAWINC